MFVEHGYRNTTLEAVADRLGYTKQSIYYYYKNKEDLVLSLCRRILEEARKDVLALCMSDMGPEHKLAELIKFYLGMHSSNPAFFALHRDLSGIMDELSAGDDKRVLLSIMKEIPKATTDVLQDGIQRGVFIKEEPKVLSAIVFGMMSGIAMVTGMESMRGIDKSARESLAVKTILKGIML